MIPDDVKGPPIRAVEVLSRLPYRGEVRGAEIGVYRGRMSEQLLLFRDNLFLYMVDSWAPAAAQSPHYQATGDWSALADEAMQQAVYVEACQRTERYANRRRVLRLESELAANQVENYSLDFVFIDADHSYEGVQRDITIWLPKVKSGGWLSGHDYGTVPHPGVKQAVDEFVAAKAHAVLELGKNATWFVKC
jgi:hypothetical protein